MTCRIRMLGPALPRISNATDLVESANHQTCINPGAEALIQILCAPTPFIAPLLFARFIEPLIDQSCRHNQYLYRGFKSVIQKRPDTFRS
jgi:hypothetical protein